MGSVAKIQKEAEKVLKQPEVSAELQQEIVKKLKNAQEEEEKIEKFSDYLLRGFLSSTHPNGYKNWSYAEMLASDETDDTTNNSAEALNSQFGKFALSGVTSYAQMLTRTYEFHIEYTESSAEKRQNDKMNKRSEKINKKIEARIKKIKSFRKLPREEQNKVFISHLQLLKLAPITNQKASQESSDESETGSENSSETGSM